MHQWLYTRRASHSKTLLNPSFIFVQDDCANTSLYWTHSWLSISISSSHFLLQRSLYLVWNNMVKAREGHSHLTMDVTLIRKTCFWTWTIIIYSDNVITLRPTKSLGLALQHTNVKLKATFWSLLLIKHSLNYYSCLTYSIEVTLIRHFVEYSY